MAEEGVDSIEISTQDPTTFAPGSVPFSKISAFFDKVILNREQEQLLQRFGSESSQNPISPLPHSTSNRHPVLDTDTFDSTHVPTFTPQTQHYPHGTRNQRHMTPRIIPDSSDYASSGFRADLPHLSIPHSRPSQGGYSNILDAP